MLYTRQQASFSRSDSHAPSIEIRVTAITLGRHRERLYSETVGQESQED